MTLPPAPERVLKIASVRRLPLGYVVRVKFRGGKWRRHWRPTRRQAYDFLADFIS